MLNVLLGQGNDRLTITGTLDPADRVVHAGHVHGRGQHRADGRRRHVVHADPVDGTNWATGAASDFVVGQQVMVSGVAGTFRVVAVAGNVLTLERLAGAPVPLAAATNVVKTVSVPGPHGGLTVVHGGGNFELQVNAQVDVAATSLTRRDGLCVARRRLPDRPADLDRRARRRPG